MSGGAVRKPRPLVVVSVILLGLTLQAANCPNAEKAMKETRDFIITVLTATGDPPPNWRVHWKLLKKETVVSSFDFAGGGGLDSYECNGWCVVFFVDLNPFAHYAHPTRIIVFDSKPESEEYLHELDDTKWWPTIRELGDSYPVSIFNTVASREDPRHIFIIGDGAPDGELPLLGKSRESSIRYVAQSSTTGGGGTGPLGPPPTPMPTGPGIVEECDSKDLPVWAILVNGYHDEKNTFDEDVFGMYSVLGGIGVAESRIQVLSPFEIEGIATWEVVNPTAVETAFKQTLSQMEPCAESFGDQRPHFLLFWSSHGLAGKLACNSADGMTQESVNAIDIDGWLKLLEDFWENESEKSLATTVVIEACESGTTGNTLKATNSDNRWIFSSAGGPGSVSCSDIDENFAGKDDPNPADTGSETIWGYIEAFGTASADTDSNGKISFEEAIKYAMMSDVGYIVGVDPEENTCEHKPEFWMPAAPDPMLPHGAWNTSARVAAQVSFSAPVSTATALSGNPVEVDVTPGDQVKIELNVKNQDAAPEIGVLALRLFRNDETDTTEKWKPQFYQEDDQRTTVMIPGLGLGQSVLEMGAADIPASFQEGDEMRMVVTLDSGQPSAAAIVAAEDPKSEIVFKVQEQCTTFCCWWRGLWD